MKTRILPLGCHGLVAGALVVIVLSHLVAFGQCQRPFTNTSLQQNAIIKHQATSYSDQDDIRSGANYMRVDYREGDATEFDGRYPLSSQSEPLSANETNRDRKPGTFQELRKNLKEQRQQWDRQHDDPGESNPNPNPIPIPNPNQNLMKIIKSRIMKSDVSSFLFHFILLSCSKNHVDV